MASSTSRLAQLSNAHAAQRDGIISTLIKRLLGIWSAPSASMYNPTLISGQAAQSALLVTSALTSTRSLTRSFTTSVLREVNATPKSLPPIRDYYPRPGVAPLEVYSRPAVQFQWSRSQGATVDEAMQVALERLQDVAESDVKLVERDETSRVYQAAPKVIGYRRIIHPELSRTGTCGLCAVAATRFYTKAELLPLHYPSCHCDTLPIVKGDDPGFRLNEDDLKQVYAAAGDSTAADDLRNTRISIDEHGELGPVLVRDGQHFKTAAEAGRPRWAKPTPQSIRVRQQANVENTAREAAAAQSALDAFIAANPDSKPGDAERLGLFRAVKSLNDLLRSQQAALARATN